MAYHFQFPRVELHGTYTLVLQSALKSLLFSVHSVINTYEDYFTVCKWSSDVYIFLAYVVSLSCSAKCDLKFYIWMKINTITLTVTLDEKKYSYGTLQKVIQFFSRIFRGYSTLCYIPCPRTTKF
jgi:hypothetical protein